MGENSLRTWAWLFSHCIVLAWFGSHAPAQPGFTTTQIFEDAPQVNSLSAADLDADGDLDLIATSASDARLRWCRNDGGSPASFTVLSIGATVGSMLGAAAGDLNNDGDIDIVVAANIFSIRYYENNGAPQPAFTERIAVNGTSTIDSVFLADVNGDGFLDIVAASGQGDDFQWFENDGGFTPTFTPHNVDLTHTLTAPVAHADDLDGDGDTDLIFTSFSDGNVRWYENDGAPNPGFTMHTLVVRNAPESIFTIDLNFDGRLDIVIGFKNNGGCHWYENQGGSPAAFIERTVIAGRTVSGVFAADVNGDGYTDVVTASPIDQLVEWHENDRNFPPAFVPHEVYSAPTFDNSNVLLAADIDADGDTDLASAAANRETIYLHESDLLSGRVAFAERPVVNRTTGAVYNELADALAEAGDRHTIEANASAINGPIVEGVDLGAGFGAPELALITLGDLDAFVDTEYTLEDDLLASVPATEVGPPRTVRYGPIEIPIGRTLHAEYAGFMRLPGMLRLGDGSMLEAAAAIDSWDEGQILLDHGARVSVAATNGSTIRGSLDLPPASLLDFSVGQVQLATVPVMQIREIGFALAPVSTDAGDIDGDGDIDVVSATLNFTEALRWHESTGGIDPSFTTHLIPSPAVGNRVVRLRDLDGDGDLDILTASASAVPALHWHENDGMSPPSFTARPVHARLDFAEDLETADLDGDGDLDVIATYPGNHIVRWYSNNGDTPPTFTEHTFSTIPQGPSGVAVGDLDNDADIDVLIASGADNAIRWFENDGAPNPSFTQHDIHTSALNARDIHAADLNGDGDLDIVSCSLDDGTVRWHENDGQSPPSFNNFDLYVGLLGPVAVATADINGDGHVDLLSGNQSDRSLIWYQNNGDDRPGFTPRTFATGGAGGTTVNPADLDADGRSDVISTHFPDNAVRWFRNGAQASTISPGAILAAADPIINRRRLTVHGGVILSDSNFQNRRELNGYGDFVGQFINDGIVTLLADTRIVGDYGNNNLTIIQNGTLTVLGTLANFGTIIGDFSGGRSAGDDGLFAAQGFHAGALTSLTIRNGLLTAADDVDVAINDHTRFDLATSTLKLNALSGVQSLEVMSIDIGPDPDGLDRSRPGHFPLGTLRVGPTATVVRLVDVHDNAADGQTRCEALYASHVTIEPGATLLTGDCIIYYETLTLLGQVDTPANLIQITRACSAADLTEDGILDFFDVLAFLQAFSDGNPIADMTGDEVLNFFDVLSFLQYFSDGCP